jgi:arylsulfatase A-like enzyme
MNQRPNILFLIADDHRHDAFHAAGDPIVETPVLDRLAERGVMFRRAHMLGGMCGAVCVPARGALHTGVNPLRCSVSCRPDDYEGQLRLRAELPLLGETLRTTGYHTHVIGKWHNDTGSLNRSFVSGKNIFLGGMSNQYKVRVRDYDPSGQYPKEQVRIGEKHSSELFTDSALEFLREYRGTQPYFLYVAFTSPHDPRTAPEPYASRYRPESIPVPPNFMPQHPFDNGELWIRDEQLAPFPRTPEIVQRHIADYYAMISHLDAQIGRLVEAVGEDTLIVYLSDHGLGVGQHGLLGKQNVYDHSVRVPLLVSGPGIPAGKRVEPVVLSYGLFPTLCEYLGIPVPASVEARSLWPLVTGAVEGVYETVFSCYTDAQRMVSDGRWKLIRYRPSQWTGRGTTRTQLFDLETDPWETTDLSAVPAARPHLERLAAAMTDWERRIATGGELG